MKKHISGFIPLEFLRGQRSSVENVNPIISNRTLTGFTLIEILIVIGIIAILAAVVIVAINPGQHFSEANNTVRTANVEAIANAITMYRIDKKGSLATLALPTTAPKEICATGTPSCGTELVDLSLVTTGGKYGLEALPADPECPDKCLINGIGYNIIQTSGKKVKVCAPDAELSKTICTTL